MQFIAIMKLHLNLNNAIIDIQKSSSILNPFIYKKKGVENKRSSLDDF